VRERVEARVGKLPVSGRYHRLPRRLEDDYQVKRKALGHGATGEVRVATRVRSVRDCRYAVKSFRLAGILAKRRAELEAEVEVYLSVDHPHISRLVDVYESKSHLYIVMECMEGGELLERLHEVERFEEKDAAEAMFQMLLAISYLHSLGIVHRDVKAENFLFDEPGAGRLKLIDFGLSAVWQENAEMADICGTLSYVAPEVLRKSYTSQCDMWSLGVILFLLLSGSLPFKAVGAFTNQMAAISKGVYKFTGKGWKGVSQDARNFTRCFLEVDPLKRFDAPAALQHHWLSWRRSKASERDELDLFVVEGLRKFGRATKFQRTCMSMMAWSISSDESEVFRSNFLRIDKAHNGRITFPELLEALKKGSVSGTSSVASSTVDETLSKVADFGEMLRIFAAMDANGDWRVQYTDFLAAMMTVHIETAAKQTRSLDRLLLEAFERFDFDRNGKISSHDLQQVLNVSAEEAQTFIKEAGAHRKGGISYSKFVGHVTGQEIASKRHIVGLPLQVLRSSL